MVTRRSPPDSADAATVEALRSALAEREAEVEALRGRISELVTVGQSFLSDAAHAIRSPLTVTHSYLEILCSDLREGLSEEQLTFLGIARENADKLRRLIDDLVDLASLETGTAQIDLGPVRVGELVDTVHSDLSAPATAVGLELSRDVATDLPEVIADRDRLAGSLRQLVENSIRFTPEGGSIVIRARRDRELVEISVVDNGIGIPAGRIEDAFRAFIQLHRTPGENRQGYGLGLALALRSVETFNGTLELTSDEGRGTTATIRIPFAVAAPAR